MLVVDELIGALELVLSKLDHVLREVNSDNLASSHAFHSSRVEALSAG